jgi:hypothetical protein
MDQERIQGCHLAYSSQENILGDPAYSDMFLAAETDESYKQVVTEVQKGRMKSRLQYLPKTHPALAFKYA